MPSGLIKQVILLFCLGTTALPAIKVSARDLQSTKMQQVSENVPIPDFYHGKWSGTAAYCPQETPETYFIDSIELNGWDVSWRVLRTVTSNDDGVLIHAMHEKTDAAWPVQIILRKTGIDTISLQECRNADCWNIRLHRCRPAGFEE